MNATRVAVGVDNGGTWIRLCVRSGNGTILRSLRKPSPPFSQLPRFLRKQLSPYKSITQTLVVGSKGVWKKEKRAALKRALQGLAREIEVLSDVEAAWWTTFGTRTRTPPSGVILISGTGSISYGRRRDGRFARAGGLGPKLGDEGSGYWIGKEWLNAQRASRYPKSAREVAALTPRVIARARNGDRDATRILSSAHHHLLALISSVARALEFKSPLSVGLHGSVLGNAWFRKGLLREARRRGIRLRPRSTPKDLAAALAQGVKLSGV